MEKHVLSNYVVFCAILRAMNIDAVMFIIVVLLLGLVVDAALQLYSTYKREKKSVTFRPWL